MQALRRSLSLALLALLLVLVAGPVAAARCEMRGYCPMMAKASASVPCQGSDAAGGMSAPMDCCRPRAVPVPMGTPTGLEPVAAAIVSSASVIEIAGATAPSATYSRAGKLHPLGLFTLHSVWRI